MGNCDSICPPWGDTSESLQNEQIYQLLQDQEPVALSIPSSPRSKLFQEEPWGLQPNEFDNWYANEIRNGVRNFKEECAQVIHTVVQVLYQRLPLKVKKVVKGGSLAKGTVLKGRSDFDCVVFVDPSGLPYLKDVRNMPSYVQNELAETIDHIYETIENHSTVVSIKKNTYMVTAVLRVAGLDVKVDMVPSADNLDYEGKHHLYESMMRRKSRDREFYSASLVKLQNDFIKWLPGPVKELIRLVKYWNTVTVRASLYYTTKELPTSYPMELITVYAWEEADSPDTFDHLQGFKAVLIIISEQLHNIRHYWTDNYDTSVAEKGIKRMDGQSRRRPIILDPANPTNNVCARFHDSWFDVAYVARCTLQSELLQDIEVTSQWQTSEEWDNL